MAKNVLRFGSSGDAVALVQKLLNEGPKPVSWTSANPRPGAQRGFRSWSSTWPWPLMTDGVFGLQTEAAVEAYQARNGLVVDGVVGGNTWAKLLEGRTPDEPPVPALGTTKPIPSGTRLVDSYPYSLGGTADQAKALRRTEIDGLVGYLGVINRARVAQLFDARLGFMAVTLANRFDPAKAIAQAEGLGYPKGATIVLDLEGRKILNGVEWPLLGLEARNAHAKEIWDACARWRAGVATAGYKPTLYVGSPQPLTTAELTDLKFDGYWNALSRESDRNGQLAEPLQGYNLFQMIPEMVWRDSGVFVDVNIVGQDFRQRLPSWAVR